MVDINMPWYEERIVVEELGPCWEWRGMKDKDGYGVLGWYSTYGTNNRVHRFVLSLMMGRALEPDEWACHHCDNPPCARPEHLYLGSATTNSRDRSVRGRAKGTFKGNEAHPNHRLTDRQVRKIRSMYRKGYLQQEIADEFNITQPTVSRIVRGERRG